MRVLSSLLAISAASSVYATIPEASLYVFGPGEKQSHSSHDSRSISPETARLLLSRRLGVSRYHSLKDASQETIELLNRYGGQQEPLYAPTEDDGPDLPGKLLVIVEGVENADELIESGQRPTFKISNPPSSSSNLQLALDFLAQDRERRGSLKTCDKEDRLSSSFAAKYINGGFSQNDPRGYCISRPDHSPVAAGSELSKALEEHFWKFAHVGDYSVAVLQITSLEPITRQYGLNSDHYRDAVRALKIALYTMTSEHQESTIILMPPSSKVAKRTSSPYGTYDVPSKAALARQVSEEDPLTLSSGPAKSPPSHFPKIQKSNTTTRRKGPIPLCFSNLESCNAGTSNCSGHGSCFKKYTDISESTPVDCFACSCGNSTRKNSEGKIKTTLWGGTACQKKDVSMPFFLIAGFTIAMVATVAWAIGLLFSIGEEDLPSVIGAGVTGPRAQK